jgi:hypothetical protein
MRNSFRRAAILTLVYCALFILAAWLDLATTALALTRHGFSEGNVYATSGNDYDAARAWLISGAGGLMILGFLIFGLMNQAKVAETWLRQPIRSFGKFYINPFASGVIDRSPLHMLSFVIAFVPLRLLAALNNLLIFGFGVAPIGWLVGRASRLTTPTIGFWLVLGTLFYGLAFAASPVAARLIRWTREPVRRSCRDAAPPHGSPRRRTSGGPDGSGLR